MAVSFARVEKVDEKKSSALARARADLAAGRPDLARDRVQGCLHSQLVNGEYSEETYVLLGDIYFAMRDLARAGAAWMLTERSDADAQTAIDAFHKRFGTDAANILNAVKPRAPSEQYPPKVQERLRQWNYRYLPYRSRAQRREEDETAPDEAQPTLRPIEAGCIAMLIVGFFLFCGYVYLMFFGRHG